MVQLFYYNFFYKNIQSFIISYNTLHWSNITVYSNIKYLQKIKFSNNINCVVKC